MGVGTSNKDRIVCLRIAIIRRTEGNGDLIAAFKLLKCTAKLDYSLFFKLSVVSKVRGHTYKIAKNSIRPDVWKNCL